MEYSQYVRQREDDNKKIERVNSLLLENKKNIEVHKNKISDIEKFIEEVQGQKLASINAAADVKSEELKYKTLFEQNNIKRAELNKRILQNKTENSVLTENMTTHKKAYDEITEKIDALDVAGISLQNTLNELTKQNQNVQKEHSDIQQNIIWKIQGSIH